ncbi:hypothetical protein J437_LFUL019081 [Ladona fulva]|uniref:Cyclic nucleotide-binding domain-containing protein n=1 Tax=Ladona fulva TaxID=123851 RepID=A0A8K0KQV5_LADFU|nr:hypothetical protein J437_LFUL019081 [Ladona fulva]
MKNFIKSFLGKTQISEIVDCMRPVHVNAGKIIIEEGTVGSSMYVIEVWFLPQEYRLYRHPNELQCS